MGMAFDYSYDLFGVKFHLATNSFRIAAEAQMFLEEHQTGRHSLPDYRFVFAESATMPDFGVPNLRTCQGHEHQIIEYGGCVFLSTAEGMARFDPKNKTCQGHVFPLHNDPGKPSGTVPLIHLLIIRIMFAEGFLPFHAAAAVDRRGETVVLSGEKGAGKSTLAIKLHQLGFQPLCDDLVYLRPEHNRLMAGGHCQAVKIKTPEAGPLLKSCLTAQGEAQVIGKTLFPIQQFNPDGVNRLYPVGTMIFLDNTAACATHANVLPDQEVEVFRHLLETSSQLNTPACRARALEFFCNAGRCRFFLAQTSTDPDITVNEILRALDHA
jgi:hypothetical protein